MEGEGVLLKEDALSLKTFPQAYPPVRGKVLFLKIKKKGFSEEALRL